MIPTDLQFRLRRGFLRQSGIGGPVSFAAVVLALAMVLVVLVSNGAQACQSNAQVGAGGIVAAETQAVELFERSVVHAVPRGVDLRRTHEIRVPRTEGNVLGCCGTMHAPGTGCPGGSCASCVTAITPADAAAYVPLLTARCLWGDVASAAAREPASLFRPPRLDV